MGFKVKDKLEVTIYFNNKEYPLDIGNQLNELHIAESTKTILPTLYMSITDGAGTLIKSGLTDGTTIDISIVVEGSVLYECHFILYTYSVKFNGSSYTYEIDAYYNSPKYWAGTLEAPLSGTSSGILQEICRRCSLKYEGDKTNDSRSVYALNRSYKAVTKYIANTAWGGGVKYYCVGITFDGKMIFKNVLEKVTKPTWVFSAFEFPDAKEDNGVIISSYYITSLSGSLNSVGGYKTYKVIQSVVENPSVLKEVTFFKNTNNADVNLETRKTAGKNLIIFSPILTETNSYHEKAKYYSQRAEKILSYEVTFMTLNPTKVSLLDSISFFAKMQSGDSDPIASGNYIISSRAIHILGNQYTETFTATRMGSNVR